MIGTVELEKKIRDQVYEFFSDECGVDISELNDDTDIISDIEGDSLMFLQLLESWKKEYNLNIEFRVIGKYMTKNPANTIGKAIDLALLIINDREKFLSLVEQQG
ncbi:MAG TPA: acyl carrier protein [Clostridia bacterium]|nr:acyl carrier protein [Clostridia bacterium]